MTIFPIQFFYQYPFSDPDYTQSKPSGGPWPSACMLHQGSQWPGQTLLTDATRLRSKDTRDGSEGEKTQPEGFLQIWFENISNVLKIDWSILNLPALPAILFLPGGCFPRRSTSTSGISHVPNSNLFFCCGCFSSPVYHRKRWINEWHLPNQPASQYRAHLGVHSRSLLSRSSE